MRDYSVSVKEYIELEKETLDKLDVDAINAAMNLIMQAYEGKHNIYIFEKGIFRGIKTWRG